MDNISDLKPSLLWKYFEEILKIPHCSGNEEALGDYIVSVAKKLNLDHIRDKTGNVIVSKKATPGYEKAEGVILQGHLDMVCEKNSDVTHDFAKDPINMAIEGEWASAKGTTLGADNGIGVSASLAIMEDNSLIHPALEFLFTIEEETGLKGASQLQPGVLKGKKLLNLDSEDEGEFTIGCAGGADSQIIFPLEKEPYDGASYQIKLSGFLGGHSGVDINLGRGNSIKLLSRLLWEVVKDVPFKLAFIKGGNLRNAIPRESLAEIILTPGKELLFQEKAQKSFKNIKAEFKATDPDVRMSIEKSDNVSETVLSPNSQRMLLNLLYTLPHGIISMHPEIKDLVETSTNLAVVLTHTDKAEIICSTRSSSASALEATRNILAALSEITGAEIIQEEGYPGWKPNLESSLLKRVKIIYKELFNKEPTVAAIHAGLECGIIGDKFPGMDMISFGPTIKFPHSPGEKVHLSSVEKFWKFLNKLLTGV